MKTKSKQIILILSTIISILLFSIIISNAVNANVEYVAQTYIDYPDSNPLGGNITLEGWIMTNDTESIYKVYIDGSEANIISQERLNRNDVIKAIKGYGSAEQNKQPGIRLTINSSNLTTGNHILTLKIISRENKVISESTRNFKYEEEKAKICIDTTLQEPISSDYKFRGWVMSNDAEATVKIYVDNNEQNRITRLERQDVLNAITGYGTKIENPQPGFEYTIKAEDLIDGTHSIKVVVLSGEGKIIEQTTTVFVVEKYKARTYIDYPINTLAGNFEFEGWILTNDQQSTYKLYIDNNEQKDIQFTRTEREDVLKAIKDYGTEGLNKLPGIKCNINTQNLSKGKHSITLKVFSREGKTIAEYTENFTLEDSRAKICIDTTLQEPIISDYKFRGWVMSNAADATIKIYVDNNEQSGITRLARQDVLNAITGYGTKRENPQPGFEYTIKAEDLIDGTHSIKVVVLSGEGKIIEQTTTVFVVEKYKARTYIDYPINTLAGNFEFEGWILTNDQQSTYKLYIDNNEQKDIQFTRTEREDVLKAIKDYGTEGLNKLPGIKCNINTQNLSKGKHSITLKVFSREGKTIAEYTENFTLEDSKAKVYIDKPISSKQVVYKNCKIEGWVMSNDKDAKIKIYVDEKEQNSDITRTKRQDVLKAISGYGTEKENPTPGFESILDLSGLDNGEHTLKIEVYSGTGEKIQTQEQKFILDKYKTKIHIETPAKNEEISTSFTLRGWIMSEGNNPDIKVYIDDTQITDIQITRKQRSDVIREITGYGTINENPTPGFEAEINTSKILDGKHTLKILAIANNEETSTIETLDLTVKKYQTTTYIDEPTEKSTRADQITISGWAMSELSNKKVIVKIDDTEIGNVQYVERTDVINAIQGYGTINENPTPGFKTTADISSFAKGTHTIKIQVYSNETNEVIHEQTQEIVFLGKITREVLTYGYSGAYIKGVSGGSELQCYKYGDGPNVLFATFCVHGFEDSWYRDGEILVNIANNFYNKLIQDQDYSLAEKWTIYIFPEVNPDGRRMGTTNYGPGRTTLYSTVGKGIDINRSWQTGSSYERYTSNRNYNGTAGFQAYEAKYLRDFMLTHKTSIGQNVVIDLHGWEDQLIGDASICKYYKTQYPSCRTTSYGKYGTQYLISWARLNLGAKSALVELPLASSMAQANSMKLSDKYITATLNFLREM